MKAFVKYNIGLEYGEIYVAIKSQEESSREIILKAKKAMVTLGRYKPEAGRYECWYVDHLIDHKDNRIEVANQDKVVGRKY